MRQSRLVCTRPQMANALRVSLTTLNVFFSLANNGEVASIKYQAACGSPLQTVYDLSTVCRWLAKMTHRFTPTAESDLRGAAFEIEAR